LDVAMFSCGIDALLLVAVQPSLCPATLLVKGAG
jgi:hypothetical protein